MKSLLFFAALLLARLVAPAPALAQTRDPYADEHAEPTCVQVSRHSSCPISAAMSDEQIRRCLKCGAIPHPPVRVIRPRKQGEKRAVTQFVRAH